MFYDMKTLNEFTRENLDVQELLTTEELSDVMGGLCWGGECTGGACTAGECSMGACTMGSCTMSESVVETAEKVAKFIYDYGPSPK